MRAKRHNAPVKKPTKPRGKPKAAKKRVAVEQPALAPVKEDGAPTILAAQKFQDIAAEAERERAVARRDEPKETTAPAEKPWWKRRW